MYVCVPWKVRRRGRSPRTEAMDGCEPPGRLWKPNSHRSSARSTTAVDPTAAEPSPAALRLPSCLQLPYNFPLLDNFPTHTQAPILTIKFQDSEHGPRNGFLGELLISKPDNLRSFNSPAPQGRREPTPVRCPLTST